MLIFTLTELDVELPARSLAVTVIVFDGRDNWTVQEKPPLAMVAGTPLHDTVPTPESESETEPVTVT